MVIRRYLCDYLEFFDEVFFKQHVLAEIRSFLGSFFSSDIFYYLHWWPFKKNKNIIFKSCQILTKYGFMTQISSFKHHKAALNNVLGHDISCNIVLLTILESYKNVWEAMRGHKTSFEVILRKKQNLVIQWGTRVLTVRNFP